MEIKEDYVSFELAKLLKEKDFDWKCNSHYWSQDLDTLHYSDYPQNWNCASDDWYSCPTHQMAMKWLREIHHIHIDIIIEGNGCCIEYKTHIRPFKLIYPTRCFDSIDTVAVGKYKTYEEATEAGLKYCLENLI